MKKRILLITNGFPFGESERGFLSEEIKALTEVFDVSVLALDRGEELRYPVGKLHRIEKFRLPEFSAKEKCSALLQSLRPSVMGELLRFGCKNRFHSFCSGAKEILVYYEQGRRMSRIIADLVATEQIELVYTYWCTEATLGALLVKKQNPNVKVVTRFHGYDLYEERTKNGGQPFRTMIANKADQLIFACEKAKAYFEEHWRSVPDRMMVSYLGSGAHQRVSCKPSQTLHLVSCSNLIPLKRVERIIEGLALLPEEISLTWDHIGDGPERRDLEKLAQSRLTPRGIQWIFWGAVVNSELEQIYQNVHGEIFLTTSATEGGVPVSIQEAASMGIPAIGTAVGGIPEIVADGKTGFLLPQDPSAQEVAWSIARFLKLSEEEKIAMSENAYARWKEKFDARSNAKNFVKQFQNLVNQ